NLINFCLARLEFFLKFIGFFLDGIEFFLEKNFAEKLKPYLLRQNVFGGLFKISVIQITSDF
ncbi:hypothetical protein AFK68_04700, partial [Hydrocoleum sp. CS-953]|uniref:hypothetical protein n=1 Tax=Hydrocoleum sp. CS-953 TaxID=1671698 RepID=UPI000BC5ED7E